MRRLLAVLLSAGVLIGLAAVTPALGALATRSSVSRVPHGVRRISISLMFPVQAGPRSHRPMHRTVTRAATVRQVVRATNALSVPRIVGACPMLMVLGPELTVVYRNSRGSALAQAQVQVRTGSRGDSGSSVCFPIHFTSPGRRESLVSNSFVRMIGRLLGANIS